MPKVRTTLIRVAWLAMFLFAEPASAERGQSIREESNLIRPISLSATERDWLRDHPRIRVHFDPWPPFMMLEDGQERGITVDYIELIADQLGLEVESPKSWPRHERLQTFASKCWLTPVKAPSRWSC